MFGETMPASSKQSISLGHMMLLFVGDLNPRLPASVSPRGASVALSLRWCIKINLNATSPVCSAPGQRNGS
jgi:hypothetical protein